MDASPLPVLVDDLVDEERWLDRLVDALAEERWSTPTPADGWCVRDQISHLADGESLAALALADPAAFGAHLTALLADLDRTMASTQAAARRPGAEVLARWRAERDRTVALLRRLDGTARVPWITGTMSARSFATARLMETWAHGCDVAAALGLAPSASARLRHVAHLGVATRGFSFRNRGLAVPADEVRVELDGPGGAHWTWGPADAPERVTGPALDFCLVVTQRRHVADTALHATDGALAWLSIAQAFAGPPTSGPPPSASLC